MHVRHVRELGNTVDIRFVLACNANLLEAKMNLGTILLIILVLLLIGALPAWPYSASWGPYPAGGLGLVLIIILILALLRTSLNNGRLEC